MEKQVEEKGLQLSDLKVSNLPELQGWKEKAKVLVQENPFVEIVDTASYEEAKKSRTAYVLFRVSAEKQDKLLASKLASFRKEIGQSTSEITEITIPSVPANVTVACIVEPSIIFNSSGVEVIAVVLAAAKTRT